MATLYDWDAVDFVPIDGSEFSDGQPDSPVAIGNVILGFKKSFTIAPNGVQMLWLASNGDPSDFQYLRIKSNVGDLTTGFPMLELTTDTANIVGTQVYTVPLVANVAFKLFGSQSYAGYLANFSGGTLKKIDRLRVKNLNSLPATVSLWMAN